MGKASERVMASITRFIENDLRLKVNRDRIFKLNQSITGWVNYFGLADMKGIAAKLDG